MDHRQLRRFRDVNKQLRQNSEALYLKVMGELCVTYQELPFVRTLHGHLRSRRYDLALALADSISEQSYSEASLHFLANQFAALIRKFPWNPQIVKTDPRGKAIATFLKAEHKCERLNKKFRLYDTYRSPYEYQLNEMRNFIRYSIGIEPNISAVLDKCDFGSGASIGTHGNATHLLRKIGSEKWTVSSGASFYAFEAVMRNHQLRDMILPRSGDYVCFDWDSAHAEFQKKTRITRYNKINFVPKTAKTHRAIAVEPLLNGYLQKGADSYMRHRLKRIGIDLSDQSKNQRMAQLGSTDDSENGFVTIDLSSASDSISIGLVRSLLPDRWFSFLDDLRSKEYQLDGKDYIYHKFCSMGNGFCFPLETLLFVACCKACGCGTPGIDFSVYGDDIIVRQRFAPEVLKLLRVLGFSPNKRKTFLQGPFRESCGSDWFGGVDVRPYTLDYKLDSIENLYKWLNLTQRNESTLLFFSGVRRTILNAVPPQFRFIRPFKGNADSGIDGLDSEHLSCPHCRFNKKKQIWEWKELSHSPVGDTKRSLDSFRQSIVDMYALLRGSPSRRGKVEYTFRRKTRATVVRVGHGGSTSTWIPTNSEDVVSRLGHLARRC